MRRRKRKTSIQTKRSSTRKTSHHTSKVHEFLRKQQQGSSCAPAVQLLQRAPWHRRKLMRIEPSEPWRNRQRHFRKGQWFIYVAVFRNNYTLPAAPRRPRHTVKSRSISSGQAGTLKLAEGTHKHRFRETEQVTFFKFYPPGASAYAHARARGVELVRQRWWLTAVTGFGHRRPQQQAAAISWADGNRRLAG